MWCLILDGSPATSTGPVVYTNANLEHGFPNIENVNLSVERTSSDSEGKSDREVDPVVSETEGFEGSVLNYDKDDDHSSASKRVRLDSDIDWESESEVDVAVSNEKEFDPISSELYSYIDFDDVCEADVSEFNE